MFVVGNEKMRVQRATPYDINMSRNKRLRIVATAQNQSIPPLESNTFEPLDFVVLNKEPKDNIQLLSLDVLREGSPSLFPSLNELCWLDLSHCDSLLSLPTEIFKLKFLKRLYLLGYLNLEKIPEIKETVSWNYLHHCSIWLDLKN